MTAPPKGGRWGQALGILGLVWYGFGLAQMWLGVTLDTQAAVAAGALTQGHAEAIDGTPWLIWLAFALASVAGLLGSLFLLLCRPAYAVFLVSLAAAGGYYLWVYGLSGTGGVRPLEEAMIGAVVVSVTLAYSLLARRVR